MWLLAEGLSFLPHGLSASLPDSLHDVATGFPQKGVIWERPNENHDAFYNLISEVTYFYFYCILLVT